MNILQFFENLWPFKSSSPTSPVTPPPTPTPSGFQNGINVAGKALDDLENALNTLQSVASVLPGPYSAYVAAVAVPVHALDAYVDSIETPVATTPTPTPVPTPVTPAPSAPTA